MTWNINWQEKLLDIYLKETKVCEVLKQGCENWKESAARKEARNRTGVQSRSSSVKDQKEIIKEKQPPKCCVINTWCVLIYNQTHMIILTTWRSFLENEQILKKRNEND